MKNKSLEKEFNHNQKTIVELLNRNIDIQYELEVSKAEEIFEEERTVGRGKNKKTHLLKIMKWTESFYDEDDVDKKDPVNIEMNHIIEVDGKKSDGWHQLNYYTYKDI